MKGSAIFGPHRIVLLLIVHLLLGFRRLRDVDYYRDDPLVRRLLGLHRLPDVATICRTLVGIASTTVYAEIGGSHGSRAPERHHRSPPC